MAAFHANGLYSATGHKMLDLKPSI